MYLDNYKEFFFNTDSYNKPTAKDVSWLLSSLRESSGLGSGFAGGVVGPGSSVARVTGLNCCYLSEVISGTML